MNSAEAAAAARHRAPGTDRAGPDRTPGGAPVPPGVGARPRSAALAALERGLEAASPVALRWTVPEVRDGAASVERLRALAPAADRAAVIARLRESGFRPIAPSSRHRVPDASDWFGVDPADGTLLHVCLQERLVLGAAADRLTVDRVRDASVAALVDAAPCGARAMSLALALCERTLRGAAGAGPPGSPDGTRRDAGSRAAFEALFGPEPAARLLDAAVAGDGEALGTELRRTAPPPPVGERPRRSAPARRERAAPAPLIVVIGSDGSGKSTVSRWLAETLDSTFGARFLYFGTGDGPGSFVRIALNRLKRRSRFGAAPPRGGDGDVAGAPRTAAERTPTPLRLVWAAVVGWERVGKMRALERARRAGLTIVTDRFPQNEQGGIHDGPRLAGLADAGAGGPVRALARFERTVYARLARRVPDRVLLLDVPLDLALQRRPEEPEAELARRIAVARSLRYGGAPRLVLDASAPLGTVKARALCAALDVLTCDGVPPEP